MTKPKLPCGIHFCPMALRLLWPIKAILIKDIATVYGVGIAETTRRAERIGYLPDPGGPARTFGAYSRSWSRPSKVRVRTGSRETSGYPS